MHVLVRRITRSALVPVFGSALVLALAITPLGSAAQATATLAGDAATAGAAGDWAPRPEDYPGTVTRSGLQIPMSDGTILRGDLILPADATGKAIAGRFPTIVTITAYNKSVQQYAGGLAGGDPAYLVKRGYAQLTVDARGTGTSGGTWCAFCTRENTDATEVMAWAHRQPWSNGDTGMAGPSYMGIDQIFAAAGRPPGLKAIFPQVPAADVYRDVVASGGQLDVGFIPLWLGLVNGTALIPPATPPSDLTPLTVLLEHLLGNGAFTTQLLLQALAGGETAYDGDFYAQRSPINVVSRVEVPTFLISGEYDLFQRGTPLLFENLQRRGVPTKMVIGPWNHLQASGGEEVARAGLGTLDELKLRWFDHWVKGVEDPALDRDIPPVTYYEQGTGDWRSTRHWVGPDRRAVSYRLSGSARTAGTAGRLTRGTPKPGSSDVLPIPVAGLCTRSTSQWTAGLLGMAIRENPCDTDNALNDKAGVVFRTKPLTEPFDFQGPMNARLYVSSTTGDGMLAVAVEDEAPDGTVSRLSGGWQVISHRALDKSRSRYLDGKLIQPYHPFTRAAQAKLPAGSVRPVDVEIFPTGASVRPGHRLRIAVQAFDVPHLLPTLPDAAGTLGVVTLHTSPDRASVLTLPAVAPARTRIRARLARQRTGTGRHNRVRVRVTSADRPVPGRVRVRVDGKRVRTARLRHGRAVIRLPKARHPGRHVVRVRYLPADDFRPAHRRLVWRVRR